MNCNGFGTILSFSKEGNNIVNHQHKGYAGSPIYKFKTSKSTSPCSPCKDPMMSNSNMETKPDSEKKKELFVTIFFLSNRPLQFYILTNFL